MKRLERKTLICIVLCIVLVVGCLSTFAYNSIVNNAEKPYMTNGVIYFKTEDAKKTSNIYYRTVGWNVHKTEISSRDITKSGQQYAKIFPMEQYGQEDSLKPGYIISYFRVPKAQVDIALSREIDKSSGLPMTWEQGETVYFSAIMEVRRDNGDGTSTFLGRYSNYSDLINSQAWAHPEDFEKYYNIKVPLDFEKEEVHKKIKVNGELISDEVVANTFPGEHSTVDFDETIEYQGKTYRLNRSCLELRGQLGRVFGDFQVPQYPIGTVAKRNIVQFLGGINVYGHYVCDDLSVRIQHFDKDTGKKLKDDEVKTAKNNEAISASAESFDKKYIYSVISEDNGSTWHSKSEESTRTVTVKKDTIIRFYYGQRQSNIMADLSLSASPSAIKDGTSSTVKFTLNASGSTSDYKITQYDFLFSDSSNFTNAKRISSKTPIVEVTETGVTPGSSWYGKVTITDEKGNSDDATDNLTIGVLQDIKVFAGINSVSVSNNSKANINDYINSYQIEDYITKTEIDTSGTSHNDLKKYNVYLKKDNALIKELNENTSAEMFYNINISSSKSWSTNGIDTYLYKIGGSSGSIGEYSAKTSSSKIEDLDGDLIRLDYSSLQYMYIQNQTVEIPIILTVNDRVQMDETDTTESVVICFQVDDGESMIPDVALEINRNVFGIGETAIFTPSFTRNELITDKKWTIENSDKEVVLEGNGEIGPVILNLAEGHYRAKQYIYYTDTDNETIEDYAEVKFEVIPMREPDVTISCDKEKYRVGETGYFEVVCTDDSPYTYMIDKKEWKLVNTTIKQTVLTGEGEFPSEILFEDSYPAGQYQAYQTIYWHEGESEKNKTASCKFTLISDKPVAALDVSIKTYTDWEQIGFDEKGEMHPGMQYKQIRIDLSKSLELNQMLENPYDILWDSEETQIAIVPLAVEEGTSAIKIFSHTESKEQMVEVQNDQRVEQLKAKVYKGQKYIDVRFDTPGHYLIKGKVANKKGSSQWVEQTITIAPDLTPTVDITIEGAEDKGGVATTYRQEDLHVRFKVNLDVKAQDVDAIDYESAKLIISYDKNGDGKIDSNDGAYVNMVFSKDENTLQQGFSVVPNENNTSYEIDFFDGESAVLGEIAFDYIVGEIPYYPDYVN